MSLGFSGLIRAGFAAVALALGSFSAPVLAQSEPEIVMAAPRDLAPGPQDAYYTSVILYVWEPLIIGGEDGEPKPGLAVDWTPSEDARQWTFSLRPDVTFHDGTPLNADAVLANFERFIAVSPKSSPFYTMNVDTSYPGLSGMEKVDDLTFRLDFDAPLPTLPYAMVNFSSPIYAPASFDENGDFATFPIGTGPFKLVEHEPLVSLLLERFDEYWGEPAAAEHIRVRVIPDPDTRLSALRAEEIMGVMDLGAIPPEQGVDLARDERFELSVSPSTISHYMHPNGRTGIFADPRLRKAASLAIDRNAIVSLYRDFPTPTANIINVTSPFHVDIPIEHDPEAAVALAEEVLGGERAPVLLIVPSYGVDRYPYRAQAELIQFMLAPLGLDVEVRILDGAAFRDAQAEGEYDLALATQGLPNADPFTMFNNYMSSTGSQNASYSLGYASEEVDALLARASAALDIAERGEIYAELQRIAAEDLPTIPLFNDATVLAYNVEITGYQQRLYGTTLPQAAWAK